MNFNSPVSYILSGNAGLNMDVSSGQATVSVTAGSHTIAAPLVLNDDTLVTTAPGSGIAITSGLIGPGKSVTKSGGGTMALSLAQTGAFTVALAPSR